MISTPRTAEPRLRRESRLRRPARDVNSIDPCASWLLHAQDIRVLLEKPRVQIDAQGTPGHPPVSDQLVHDPSGQVDRDAEADPLVTPAVGRDRVVDADHFAFHVDERPARVTRVDRRVGLKEVLVHYIRKLIHLPPASADDPLADGMHQAKRASQRHHPGANPQPHRYCPDGRPAGHLGQVEGPRCRPWRHSRPSRARSTPVVQEHPNSRRL